MTFTRVALAAALLVVAAIPSVAQTPYPDKPIRIINPFPAGSPVDFVGRLAANKLEGALGQPALVESRSGAGGTVGANFVAKAPPDGYTLLVTTPSTVATAPALFKSLPYDPLKDFAGLWAVNSGGLVMVVHPSLPVKTLKEFIQYVKERPGQVSFASSGHGTTQHLAGELFQARTGVKLLHVPYRGGAPATTDLIAGHVGVMFDSISNTYQNIRAGKLRALAVLRPKRNALFPDLPTATEAGAPGVETSGWVGLFAPSATPKDVLGKLTSTLATTMSEPETVKRLMEAGNDDDFMVGEALQKRLAEDIVLFAEIVEKAGIEKQ
jgi:tripartite-type tricarboxylate transporter receptor subunit TctC